MDKHWILRNTDKKTFFAKLFAARFLSKLATSANNLYIFKKRKFRNGIKNVECDADFETIQKISLKSFH
jgi:hypothetical protein